MFSTIPTYLLNKRICIRRIKRLYRECVRRMFENLGSRNIHRVRIVTCSIQSRWHNTSCERRISLLLFFLLPRKRKDGSPACTRKTPKESAAATATAIMATARAFFFSSEARGIQKLLSLQQLGSQVGLQSQPQFNANAGLSSLLAGGQGGLLGGGTELNQLTQNLLMQNYVNMAAMNLLNGPGLNSAGLDGAGISAGFSAPPPNISSSKKMNNSSSTKKSARGGDRDMSSSVFMTSVNSAAFKKHAGVIIEEHVKKVRKKIALKLEFEAAIEKELKLLEDGKELHAAFCSLLSSF